MGKDKGFKALQEMAATLRARKAAADRARKASAGRQREVANDVAVNEFADRHGDYEKHLGRVANVGVSPVRRWIAAGLLSDTQQAAIAHMVRLWEITSSSGRLVANLDRTVFGCPGDGHDAEIEARNDLHRIRGYFVEPMGKWYDVFENVCRFDEPAGVAGSRLANVSRSNAEAARLIVCFVADSIYSRERLSY